MLLSLLKEGLGSLVSLVSLAGVAGVQALQYKTCDAFIIHNS